MIGGWLFWLVVAFVIWRLVAARGCRSGSERIGSAAAAERDSYIDALETRVAELEERLDFTERLVAGRRGMAG